MPTAASDLITDPRVSRKARGLRLKSLRQSLRLSRQAFSDQFKISIYTLQNWETNKNGGLTEPRAKDILQWLKRAGVECTFAWLMYGVPPAPIFSDPILGEFSLVQTQACLPKVAEDDELPKIAEELNLFRQHYPNQVMDMIISDDSMEPFYNQGDYVAGIKQTGNDIEKLLEKNCIVLTNENEWLVRKIKQGNSPGHYHLVSANQDHEAAKVFLPDVQVKMVAEIVWVRKYATPKNLQLCI